MKLSVFEKVCFGIIIGLVIAIICEITTLGIIHGNQTRRVKEINRRKLYSQVIFTITEKEIDSFGNERVVDFDVVKFNTHC